MKTKFIITTLIFAFIISGGKLHAQQINKTKVLVLGTTHLSSLSGVKETHLKRVLDSLAIYKFDAIALEQMPSELLLDIKSRKDEAWQELYSNYANAITLGEKYQRILKLSYEDAKKIQDSLLNKQNLNEADRIQLMNTALCIYDLWTASLNYQYMKNKSNIDTSTVNLLDGFNQSSNELNLIGVNLAKRLHINKLNYIDNLQDETILSVDFPSFFSEYAASQNKINELVSKASIFSEVNQLEAENVKKMDLYPLYKLLNSERYMKEDYTGQWELWLKTNFNSKTDRSRFSLWEMRNLQITANIMRLVAKYPEKTILVVIGASHKSFIEKYLQQMPDIELLKF
jgi:hypothetical protein